MNQNSDDTLSSRDLLDLEDLHPLGLLLDEGRGSLPYALIHGEALVACAAWGLGESGVQPVDTGTSWEEIAVAGEPVVLHDPLCPMTPADFIAACVLRAVTEDVVVVAVRPVTDTVKTVDDGAVGETVDRESCVRWPRPSCCPPRWSPPCRHCPASTSRSWCRCCASTSGSSSCRRPRRPAASPMSTTSRCSRP
ncbi:2-C-methyl-D-erythritol 4-phosphate cytidylyltransferase [Nocardioides daphniae]|uniref:2-C-methyl-D-erythritol 4-phosphate cytidylyltransferase n=1 Tax=Nocardioides daphniae TaxID=402297 RepID=UPI001EE9AC8D|nr:2-C-methyl-D-erythritol 4-phosphate cytidylyltransferase [Nocardioides daphniae]